MMNSLNYLPGVIPHKRHLCIDHFPEEVIGGFREDFASRLAGELRI
jgi:hypothetical protein